MFLLSHYHCVGHGKTTFQGYAVRKGGYCNVVRLCCSSSQDMDSPSCIEGKKMDSAVNVLFISNYDSRVTSML